MAVFLALAIASLLVQPVLSYIIDRKGLRKFPAPSYAGLSSLWRIWQNLQCRHFQAVDKAHRDLGTPSELHQVTSQSPILRP
jgi:hypothetical protein